MLLALTCMTVKQRSPPSFLTSSWSNVWHHYSSISSSGPLIPSTLPFDLLQKLIISHGLKWLIAYELWNSIYDFVILPSSSSNCWFHTRYNVTRHSLTFSTSINIATWALFIQLLTRLMKTVSVDINLLAVK